MSLLPTLPSLNADVFNGPSTDASTNAPSSAPNILSEWTQGLAGAVSGVTGSTINQDALNTAKTLGGAGLGSISWARIAAFIVGLLLIGGGVLMFKQTQIVIGTGRKAAEGLASL